MSEAFLAVVYQTLFSVRLLHSSCSFVMTEALFKSLLYVLENHSVHVHFGVQLAFAPLLQSRLFFIRVKIILYAFPLLSKTNGSQL